MEKNDATREAGSGGTTGETFVQPLNVQLDPGLRDWRWYRIDWNNSSKLADIVATRTAGGGYNAGKEYWLVGKANLTAQSGLVVSMLGDMAWGDATPTPPSPAQEIVADTAATWQQVSSDLTTGILYKHATLDSYVRIVITGTAPNATITTLRWYRKASTQPSSTFDPSGTYSEASSLGSGTVWYADSKSP
jgi:hypothetical protein